MSLRDKIFFSELTLRSKLNSIVFFRYHVFKVTHMLIDCKSDCTNEQTHFRAHMQGTTTAPHIIILSKLFLLVPRKFSLVGGSQTGEFHLHGWTWMQLESTDTKYCFWCCFLKPYHEISSLHSNSKEYYSEFRRFQTDGSNEGQTTRSNYLSTCQNCFSLRLY